MSIQSNDQNIAKVLPYQRQWKNLLIDRPLQMRYVLISFFIAVCLCTALGALVIWQTRQATDFFVKQRTKTTELFQQQRSEARKLVQKIRDDARLDMERLLKSTSDMIALQLKDKDADVREAAKLAQVEFEREDRVRISRRQQENQALLAQQKREDQQHFLERQQQDQQEHSRRERDERLLIGWLIFFCFVVTILIALFNIRLTHRIAGPLFKIGRYLDEIRENRLSELVGLRRSDDLHDFFARFRSMHDALKERIQQDIALMEALSSYSHKGEKIPDELRKQLDALVEQKHRAVDGSTKKNIDPT